MRFFRSEDTLRSWLALQPAPTGEMLTAPQIWELSKLWYHNRLSPDYHGRTPQEAAAIFEQMELTSEFWMTGG